MSDNFLAGVGQEGETYFVSNPDKQENETSEESPAELNETEPSPSSGGDQAPKEPDNNQKDKNVPFDKHPRWIERENEWKTTLSQYEERLKAFEERFNTSPQTPKVEIPEPFKKLYGENEEAWNEWKALQELQAREIQDRLLAEQGREAREKQEELQRWDSWRDKSISEVEQKFNVKLPVGSSEYNELLKIAVDYQPSDAEGNISFEKAYDIMTKIKRDDSLEKSRVRKSIAAATAPEPKAESEAPDYFTPASFRRGVRR